jgi:hypothetical protein
VFCVSYCSNFNLFIFFLLVFLLTKSILIKIRSRFKSLQMGRNGKQPFERV